MAGTAVIVTNTGPVIALHGIDRLYLLDRLSDRLVVPLEVWIELIAKPDATEPQALSRLGNVSVRPTGRIPPEAAHLDDGEAAAIAHAMSEPGAICLLDDLAARRAAEALGLWVRGTLLASVAAHRMRQQATALRAERLKALKQPAKVDTRPFDQGEDNAWGALYGRLEAYARLSKADEPDADAVRAAELMPLIFPNGLAFLTLDFKHQWEESDRLLHMIDKEGFAPEIDRLCLSVFLSEVRRAHEAYGDALGLTKPKPVIPEAPAIADALQALRGGIRFYARRVVALADDQDQESVDMVQKALDPILEAQSEVRGRRAKGETEPEPADEGELPPLPEA